MGPILRSAQRSAGGDATAGREPLWGARAKHSKQQAGGVAVGHKPAWIARAEKIKEEGGEVAYLAMSRPMTQRCEVLSRSRQDRAARL